MKISLFLISLLIILACSNQRIDGLKILGLFPLQGKSHFVMCERLMRGLAARGHRVDVYSHFPLKSPVPNYTDYSLAGTLPPLLNSLTYANLSTVGQGNIKKMIGEFGYNLCNLMNTPKLQQLFKDAKNQQYDVVIVEVFVSNCYIAWGQYLNIPIVGVVTTQLIDWYHEPLGNPHNTAIYPTFWSRAHYPMNFWERLVNTYLYYNKVSQYKYYIGLQNEQIERFFGRDYPDADRIISDLDLVLVNSHPAIEGIKAYTPSVVQVGGLHINDDGSKLPSDIKKWLDESKDGCIYFTFGSMVRIETFPKPVLDAFYETFKSIAPVRVLVKITKIEELPWKLPSNVMVQTWFPQLQVLKHSNIKLFITHGGLMGMQEALSVGIPMIGIPLLGDQRINLKSQANKKTAIMFEVDDINTNNFLAGVREMLSNPAYKENAEILSKGFFDRPMSPMDTSAFWIEYIVRHGKKSLESPIVDLPWYQANLIDVYGSILCFIILLCVILRGTIQIIIRLCKSQTADKKKKKN